MTKDLELRAGEVMQQGAPFAEIDGLDGWQLHAEINERDISTVEEALKAERAARPDLHSLLPIHLRPACAAQFPAADILGGLSAGQGERFHRDHR